MTTKTISPTLRQFFNDCYKPQNLIGRSARTLEGYETALNLWERFADSIAIDRVDSKLVAKFQEYLLADRSSATVNSYVCCIKALLRFAADEEVIERAPRIRKLPMLKRVPLAFTKEEFLAILKAASQERGTIEGIPAAAWWTSLLCVDWETGLRVGALLSIRSQDILLEQGGIYCQAEQQKDREAAWFPLSPATVELIRAIYSPERELLWPYDAHRRTVNRHFRTILDRSGIYAPQGGCMLFHRIRKSTASYIAQAGGDAQRKLGHSAPSVTEHYLDPRIVRPDRSKELVAAPTLPAPADVLPLPIIRTA